MLAPTITSLPSMTTARLISSMMRLARASVSQLAGLVMVKDDEFVAAPARDQVTRADDGAEPACDLDQELVAGPVPETVVDLLEVVEIEEHHGQAVARGVVATKGQSELLLETAAIGQFGDGVEPRHPVDLELGVAALGDVLNDQHGALGRHAVDGDLEGAIVERFERDDEIDGLVVGENGGETRELWFGDDAAADQFRQRPISHARRRERRPGRRPNILRAWSLVRTRRPSGFSMQRPCDMLLSAMSRRAASISACCWAATTAMKLALQPLGVALHVKDERREPHDDPDRIQAAGDDHRDRKRSECAEQLRVDAAVDRVAAGHEAERIGDRHRHAGEMREIVVRHAEGEQCPRRQRGQADDGAGREDPVPACGRSRLSGSGCFSHAAWRTAGEPRRSAAGPGRSRPE